MKTVVFFLARAEGIKTEAQPDEVSEILWLPEEEALRTLTFDSDADVLRKAAAFLREKGA